MPKRAVFLKLSGERLAEGNPDSVGVNPTALKLMADKIAAITSRLEELGISGLSLVVGAGNLVRGNDLKAEKLIVKDADRAGRLGTVLNTLMLSARLEKIGIKTEVFIAPGLAYKDNSFEPRLYSPKALKQAHDSGKVVLLAGGRGVDNATTDFAVASYARDYREVSNDEIVVLKGTQFDGVFSDDPRGKIELPTRFKKISVFDMLDDYQRFKVVDEPSLRQLAEGHLSMLIYQDDAHDLAEILRSRLDGTQGFGTLVVSERCEPVLYHDGRLV